MASSPSASGKAQVPEPSLPLPPKTSLKRPAPSLLPPFEPLSSSPGFPRPLKRQATSNAYLKYPTPVPTSSTGILSSSPPRVAPRHILPRTLSIVSERAPLSDIRSVELDESGETLLMGRSSNSSHYQLSANRLISRVHVRARYIPAVDALDANKIEIVCEGWNGLKVQCQGETWELAKEDMFTSETEGAELIIDVQDARVLLQWPRRDRDRDALGNISDSSWDDSPRPRVERGSGAPDMLHGSPLRRTTRIASPESPTPANVSASSANLLHLMPDDLDLNAPVQIYEDASGDEQELPKLTGAANVEASFMTQIAESFSSELSDPLSDDGNDPDEENDPIVHSFGPFGANLSNRLAAISASSPKRSRLPQGRPLNPPVANSAASLAAAALLDPRRLSNAHSANIDHETISTPTSATSAAAIAAAVSLLTPEEKAAVSNHVANQLAYSRLSSTPLSTIMNNLPAEEKKDLTKDHLRAIIESTDCVGIIPRQGKDAAGKPLESEYYYVPERDTDEHRRLAVTDGLRKPSLRNCRKQHKQYYWKKPRTP
ncbi:hypothetical protein B0T24DRAFT_646770 [Lasiosphaeria ovina]|uniref:FHA domain-containing protein n=1 Tax=Lasiosphaeria ovina TaxID=92902 RepID=A0AAE0NDI3_9PEZI|nr:hypothetical protein B0T24DRAFT_646770 [Lasiosphaeria ovina]